MDCALSPDVGFDTPRSRKDATLLSYAAIIIIIKIMRTISNAP